MSGREVIAWGLVVALVAAPGIRGDADGNGVVNFNDITSVNTHWGQTGQAWAEHVCDCGGEIAGPPAPTALERALQGATVHTLEGWTPDGIGTTNEALIRVRGAENEDLIALIAGAKYGSVKRLTQPVGPGEGAE